MSKKIMPTKPKGAEKRLCSLTYSQIADWVGLESRSVQQYASRGDFDPKSVESVLSWVNGRRSAKGLPMIGQVEKVDRELQPVENPIQPKQPVSIDELEATGNYNPREIEKLRDSAARIAPPSSGGYNPMTGEFNR